LLVARAAPVKASKRRTPRRVRREGVGSVSGVISP
jgi:hypothetical protein